MCRSAPAQRVLSPTGTWSFSLASSFGMCLNSEVLKGMFLWRTRYPLCEVPIKPVPKRPEDGS